MSVANRIRARVEQRRDGRMTATIKLIGVKPETIAAIAADLTGPYHRPETRRIGEAIRRAALEAISTGPRWEEPPQTP